MKKKIYLLPLTLLAVLALVTWSCQKDDEEDVCKKFEPQQCEIANACCPTDGTNCYYEYGDRKFYCDRTQATNDDPDGCNKAEDDVIAVICPPAKAADIQLVKAQLRELTRTLMKEARMLSVCN
jgi:hypothetical protein